MKKRLLALMLTLTVIIASAVPAMAASSTSSISLGKAVSKTVKNSTTTTVYKLKLTRDTNVKFYYKTTSKSFKVTIYDSEDYYDKYRDFDDLEGIEYISASSSKSKYAIDRYELDRGTYYIKVTASKGYYYLKASKDSYLKEFRTFTVNTIRNTSTSITGKGTPGASVKAYVNGKQIGSTVKVKSNGTYKISIPKQKSRTGVIVKMKKTGYETELEDRVVRVR